MNECVLSVSRSGAAWVWSLLTAAAVAQDAKSPPALTARQIVDQVNERSYQIWDDGIGAFQATYAVALDDKPAGTAIVKLAGGQLLCDLQGDLADDPELPVVLRIAFTQGVLRHEAALRYEVKWKAEPKVWELYALQPRPGLLSLALAVSPELRLQKKTELTQDASASTYESSYVERNGRQLVGALVWTREQATTKGVYSQRVRYTLEHAERDGAVFPSRLQVAQVRTFEQQEQLRRRYELTLQQLQVEPGDGKPLEVAVAPAGKGPAGARPDGKTITWDELSRQVVPKVLAANFDGSALSRHARSLAATIDVSITADGSDSQAALTYDWTDADDNGLLTADEVRVETVFASDKAIRKYLPTVKKAVLAQALAGPLQLFRGCRVQTVEFEGGYKMKLVQAGSSKKDDDAAPPVVYLTISADFRLLRVRVVDPGTGDEKVTDYRHKKAGELWLVEGCTQRVTLGDGRTSIETCRLTYDTKGRYPVLQRMILDATYATASGPVSIRQDYALRDLQLQWRKAPLPPFDVQDDEKAFGKPPTRVVDPDAALFGKG